MIDRMKPDTLAEILGPDFGPAAQAEADRFLDELGRDADRHLAELVEEMSDADRLLDEIINGADASPL